MPTLPPSTSIDRSKDAACAHQPGCVCRRPVLGRALIISVMVQLVLALVAIMAGSPLVGLVACGAMSVSMAFAVVAEVVAHYRVGLSEPDTSPVSMPSELAQHPGQAFW